ncbi:MAG: hypothetical protein R2695_02715 [Acidimicrobiales bacterium]
MSDSGEFSWILPSVSEDTVFTFDVIVTDEHGLSDMQTVEILVVGAGSCAHGSVDSGLGIGECYFPPDGATVQELALAACESHFGEGQCAVITGGYNSQQYGKADLGGGAESIHWHWDNHPTGHCDPNYVIGDVVAPGWCGTVVGNFLSGIPT